MPPPPRKSSRIAQLAAIKASKAGGAEKRPSPTMDSTDDTVQSTCRKKLQRPDDSPQPMQDHKDADSASLIAGDGNSVESVLPTQTSPVSFPSHEDDSSQPKIHEEEIRRLLSLIADSTHLTVGEKRSLEVLASAQTTSEGTSEIQEYLTNDALYKAIMNRRHRRAPAARREHYQPHESLSEEEIHRWADLEIFGQAKDPSFLLLDFDEYLDGAVLNFLNGCLTKKLSWEDLDADTQNRVKEWAPEAEQHFTDLTTGGEQYQLLKAWVWRVLFYNLFSADCDDKWAGEAWADYDKMLRGLQERITNVDNSFNWTFHTWRYHSVRMLHTLHGAHTDPARLDRILRKEFDPLIKLNEPECCASHVDECLKDIVKWAIYLDFAALTSKARFSFEMRDPKTLKVSGFPYKFDKNVMQCEEEPEDGTVVDFIIRPSMRIYGRQKSRDLFHMNDDSQFHTGEPCFVNYHIFDHLPMQVAAKWDESDMSEE